MVGLMEFDLADRDRLENEGAVPVEGNGPPGTRDAHWRETTVDNELMTGILDPGPNPLSAFSLASLRDLGYIVNDAVADPFSFLASLIAPFGGGTIPLVEAPLPGPIEVVNERGRIVGRIPRT